MCGIAGVVQLRNEASPTAIKKMTDCIAHRGPDAEGFLFAGSRASELRLCNRFEYPDFHPICALGHRRLSIVDLDGGAQPMCNEDGTVWITYNGEVYNHLELRKSLSNLGHVFRSDHSDTEVIIHAYEQWGKEGFDQLNGIFAFGILDLKARKLILARDHFGVKPLYYHHNGNAFTFSSEIKAILTHTHTDRLLDIQGLDDYLSFRYVPSPRTMFHDIYRLPAGGCLEFDLETAQSVLSIYASEKVNIRFGRSVGECVEEYQECFEQAVKRQLMSDVEVGALLSGGVDSSAVCAVAAGHTEHPLRTYTVGFKDFPDGNELDEASRFAKCLGSIHQNIVIDDADFIRALDDVAWLMDEPTATSSAIPLYYMTQVIKKEVKVVLTGQGADEPLAGYPRYWGERLYGLGFKHLRCLRPQVEKLPRQERLKRAFRCFCIEDTFDRYMHIYYLFNPEQKRALLKNGIPQERNPLLSRLFHQYDAGDDLGRMLYIDTRSWLSDDLLLYGDKATMINSIEARVPILDRDLVSCIESIPSSLKLSWRLEGKYIHKIACRKWLPRFVLKRPKKGFATPIDQWFRTELSRYIRNQLLGGRVSRLLFNASFIEEMIHKHQSGMENFQRHLFALLMLERWAERFNVNI